MVRVVYNIILCPLSNPGISHLQVLVWRRLIKQKRHRCAVKLLRMDALVVGYISMNLLLLLLLFISIIIMSDYRRVENGVEQK